MRVWIPVRSLAPILVVALAPALATESPLAPAQSRADDRRVLVMPFAADVEPDAPGGAGAALWLGEAAAVLLTDGLTARGLAALPREERLDAFDRLHLPMSSSLTRATMIRVGELVGASEIAFGEIRLGERLSVRARLVRLAEASDAPAVTDTAELADLFALFDRLAEGLARQTGRARPSDAAPATLPLGVFENYVKGLVAGSPAAGQRFLEAAMVQAPRDARILSALWRAYTEQGLHDRALQAAGAIGADSPLARQARFAVALSLVELGRLDGAARELATLHDQRPAAPLANALGVVELRRGGETAGTAAARHFAEAVRLEPSNTHYHFNLGYAYARAGRTEAALGALREAVRLDAADAPAHVVMGSLLAATGRPAEARRERELAVSLGATIDDVPPGGGIPDELERLPQTIEIDFGPRPDFRSSPGRRDEQATAAYHLERGRSLAESRRDREAIDELRRAIYLSPYEDEPHVLLGLVYQRGGRLAEAIDEFRVAIWARETADAHVALGRALLETGDRDAARRAAERALQLDPRSVDARELLDRIGG
jgi:tetratricopeptide (TPR) repeat protein